MTYSQVRFRSVSLANFENCINSFVQLVISSVYLLDVLFPNVHWMPVISVESKGDAEYYLLIIFAKMVEYEI